MPYWASAAALFRLEVAPLPKTSLRVVIFLPRPKVSSSCPLASRVSVPQRVGSLRR